MTQTEIRGAEAAWREYPADEWSDAIVASMKLGGVSHLFFVSGTEMSFFQESTFKAQELGRPAPELVTMVHESVALQAAIGVTMITGEPAASAVHVDVGTLHYGGAIHTAWRGGYPVLIMAGTAPRAFPGSMRGGRNGGVQYVQEPRDQGEIVRQYTKMDHRLEHQDNPGLMVSRLLQVAMSAPRGPVYLSVPRETAMLSLPGSVRFPTRDEMGVARQTWPDPDDARQVARWLVDSENPCIYSSKAGEDPRAVEELVRLAELLAIPVMEPGTPSRLNFPRTHYLYGVGPQPRDADVLLMMESWPPFVPGPGSPRADAKIVAVSNDAVLSRIKTLEFRADCWLSAAPANVARAVYEAAEHMLDRGDMARIEARRERLTLARKELLAQQEDLALEAASAPAPTSRLVGYELNKLLDSSAIILNDGLSNGGPIDAYVKRELPNTYYRSGSSTGGWGVGAAFGAKLASPGKDVVHVSGDGFYMFGEPMAALWAQRFHKAPVLTIVFVNGSYSTGTSGLRAAYPEGYSARANSFLGGAFDPTPDFAKLAETCDAYGENVTETSQVAPALKRGMEAVRRGRSAVIAVRVPGPVQGVRGGAGE
jgi:acetolactate synthase-1/2/3 large subunit